MDKILLVGFGNMGSAIASVLKGCGELYILERQEGKTKDIEMLGAKPCRFDCRTIPIMFDFLFLAIKPQDFYEQSASLIRYVSKDTVVVSIMAGVSIKTIKERLGARYVIRTMPNLPVKYNEGVIAMSTGPDVPADRKARVLDVFSRLGYVFDTQEDKMDAITAISGSGPAYFLFFMHILSNYAAEKGIEERHIPKIVAKTVKGTGALLENAMDPDINGLIQSIASKGGTTEAALTVMRYKGLPALFVEAINAAYLRAKELSER